MVFKCIKGMYKIQRNYRDAFNEEAFIDKYIEECFDKYMYIVGDISSGILRLKGFDVDMKSKNPFGAIDNYLEVSCAFGCPYYILKRIKTEDEFNKLKNKPEGEKKEEKPLITPLEKENFDKESLVLETSRKSRPNIIIDSKRINTIPKGELPLDLKEALERDSNNSRSNQAPKEEANVEMQTYVSASPDFDPSKKESFKKGKPNNQKQNKPKPNNNNNSTNKPNGNNIKKKNKNKNKKPQE